MPSITIIKDEGEQVDLACSRYFIAAERTDGEAEIDLHTNLTPAEMVLLLEKIKLTLLLKTKPQE